MSIAGGFHKAVQAAAALGMETVQIFTHSPSQWAVKPVAQAEKESLRDGKSLTKNNNQWRGKPLAEDDIAKFKQQLAAGCIRHPIAHDSYLINLASPDEDLWRRSIAAFIDELRRADALGIPYVVTHPGAFTTSSEQAGLQRVAQALDEVHASTPNIQAQCLLENTAGQGSCLGWRFEHLAAILDGIQDPDRVGVCIDTCHTFAAGYPLAERKDYLATMRALDKAVGMDKVKAFHLNDSKKPLGSRVDRHEHIGEGHLGLEPFRHLLNDRRFARVPMYMETPKGQRDGQELDAINLATLRGLVK
ncbi:MAG: deoxyribonuclease IV [Pirellulales bacterium]